MLVDIFDEHCNFDMCAIKYHLTDNIVKNIQIIETQPISDNSQHE